VTRGARPLTAAEQHAAEEAIRRAPKDVWLIAGTPVGRTYPCRCNPDLGACSPLYCPCAGRTDPPNPFCCAARAMRTAARRAA
jgi:hypothetical protein